MDQQHAQQSRQDRMLHEPVERLICTLAVPSIIIMLISALYNMADTYFVGTLGTDATAAVGVVFSLMAVIQAIGFFFGHGAGNYISRQLGAGNLEGAESMAATGFFTALLCGGVLAVLGLVFVEPLARLLGATGSMVPHTVQYLRYILVGTPFMTGSLMLNNLLRFQGSSFFGMIGMVSGAVLNVALDPLLIFVFHMGVGGAGLATMISQTVSCTVLLICSRRGDNIPIRLRKFGPSRAKYLEIVRGGAPSLFRQSINSVAVICLNHVAGLYGVAAIAAFSVVSRIVMVANSALLGFGQGFQPVCGFNYGAGRYDRVRRAFWFCVKSAFVALVILAALAFAVAPRLIEIFQKDPEVVAIGILPLRLQCLTFPFMAWVALSNMLLQTIGKPVKASVLALARQGLFYIPMLFVLSYALGLFGLQLAQPAADMATLLIAVPLTNGVLRDMKDAWEGHLAREAAGEDALSPPEQPQMEEVDRP